MIASVSVLLSSHHNQQTGPWGSSGHGPVYSILCRVQAAEWPTHSEVK